MIADDSALARKTMSNVAAQPGVEVKTARDGGEAIDLMEEFAPHLLFLDLNMPGKDGFDVLAFLKEIECDTRTVVVSANIQPEAMRRAKELGAMAFLKKPFTPVTAEGVRKFIADRQKALSGGAEAAPEEAPLPEYATDDLDALGEILNVGMGEAAAALAKLFDRFVHLNTPTTYFLGDRLSHWSEVSVDNQVTLITQGFQDGLRGEVLSFFKTADLDMLRERLGEGEGGGNEAGRGEEFILELSNIINAACLNSIASQLGLSIAYSAPVICQDRIVRGEIFRDRPDLHRNLVVEIGISMDDLEFSCDVLILFSDEMRTQIHESIEAYMERLAAL